MLLQMMSLVDRQAAMEAMSTELARQVQTQPERNVQVAKETRAEIQRLATQKFCQKPHGEDEVERIINIGVGAIITEIESKSE